ncbi:peptidoglycan DD-metalloendopeptidase family protein [Bacteroidia bacterium]|nr:peptidoglycan DD-metalloendopeptidase family protein [Bacteroidia bacterium]MDB9882032.1 peptidoglycan DD-metalloendopeptidase family protein [Bacteroidia bacterium]MDC1395869.1 peptidoglycan DD-metalloendopeptidase family protein [Bacteroidia bacterium]
MGLLGDKYKQAFLFLLMLLPAVLNAIKIEITDYEKNLLKDVQVVESILEDNRLKAKGIMGEITHLEYEVIAAQKIIRLIENESKVSSINLIHLEEQLTVLEQEKKIVVRQYQALLLEEYKNRDYKTKLYFIASSKNIGELVSRVSHLSTLKEFRVKQLKAIENKEKEVADNLAVFIGSSNQKKQIAVDKVEQISKLNSLLRIIHQKYRELESNNNSLTLQLREKNEALDKLNKEVNKAINAEANSNSASKGLKFRWPVGNGIIVGRFGVHKHSKERKVRITNNGIDILVAGKEKIMAVADGKVKAILNVPGSNTSIIIDHNGYYSVYSNVAYQNLASGSAIKQGEPFATVASDNDGMNKFHFELWKGTAKVNPEKYLQGSLH